MKSTWGDFEPRILLVRSFYAILVLVYNLCINIIDIYYNMIYNEIVVKSYTLINK